jgi:hypothetical protein
LAQCSRRVKGMTEEKLIRNQIHTRQEGTKVSRNTVLYPILYLSSRLRSNQTAKGTHYHHQCRATCAIVPNMSGTATLQRVFRSHEWYKRFKRVAWESS